MGAKQYLRERVAEEKGQEVEHGKHVVGFKASQVNADKETQELREFLHKTTNTHKHYDNVPESFQI